MKKLINSVLFCLICLVAVAQEAEQITESLPSPHIQILRKSLSYYETQFKLWEKKVQKDNKDANAWLNYFKAAKSIESYREAEKMFDSTKREDWELRFGNLPYQKIAINAYKQIPNTFEANYMMYRKPWNDLDYTYLLKAHEIRPFDRSILSGLFYYFLLVDDQENLKKTAFEIAKTDLISQLEYTLAYNILMEVEDGAVLKLSNDLKLPAMVLQLTKNIKPNVLIPAYRIYTLRTTELQRKYCENFYLKIGAPINLEEIHSTNFKNKYKNYGLEHQYFEELFFAAKKPIYIDNSNNHVSEKYQSKLYLHGLTSKFSETPQNFIYTIKDNVENNYILDFLKLDFPIQVDSSYNYCGNYLAYTPMFYKLMSFYHDKNQYQNQYIEEQKFKKLIIGIRSKFGLSVDDLVKDTPKNYPFIAAPIDFKNIEKSFAALNEVEHMGKYEVTNGEFKLFLDNLKQTKNYESYYKYYPDTTLWNKNFAQAFHDPMTNMYNCHPAYRNYPVVNITHEAAVAYCEWLTEQYNQQHPTGKTVLFRLPSEQEWRYAAGSKNEKAITPFPNDQILTNDPKSLGIKTDASSCYLGNIKTGPMRYHDDGGFHMLKVDSYIPNALGLYNTFGNVAEMTSTKGVIKGGSWADLFTECTFDKNATYAAPDPRIGFRMMIEVIPEIKHNTVVKIEKNVYCFQYEEKVRNYWSYLKEIIELYGINSIEYKNAFPDSTLWKSENIQALKNVLNIAQLKDTSMIIRTLEKTFVNLDTLTKTQLDNYLKYKSDLEFKNYLIENEYIKNLHMQNNPPIFTREEYYAGKLDSICLKEKFMFYPVVSVPTEYQKQLANSYTNKQLEKGEYAPTNPNSIYSSYVNHTYFDKVKHKSKSFPGGNYSVYELKEGVKLSDIKPFDLWENYRFVLIWKQWTPNQTK